MTPAFPARRRAEQFDSLVEATLAGRTPSTDAPADLAELVSVATSLREAPRVAPRPEFSAELRERLMAAAAQEMAASSTADATVARLTVRQPSQRTRDRRLSAAVGALAVVGATTSMAVASQGALPGDTLYPIKRTIEDVRTGFTVGNDAKGSSLLAQADSRLAEVSELSKRDRSARDADIEKALASFSEQATEASDLLLTDYQQSGDSTSLEDLRVFAAESITELSRLEAIIPESARDALADAAKTLLTIDQAAANACPTCTQGGITELPSSLVTLVSGLLPTQAPAAAPAKAKGGKVRDRAEKVAGETQVATEAEAEPDTTTQAEQNDRTGDGQQRTGEKKPVTQPDSTGTTVDPDAAPTNRGEALGDVVEGVGGVVTGVENTVDGVLGGVGGVVGGVVGGLLGGPSASPTP